MSRILTLVLIIACGCTGTRTTNPGNEDVPDGIFVAASKLQRETDAELSTEAAAAFGVDSRSFALALYRELAQEPGNLFFSPYSIRSALAMTYAGAKGETASEMASALHFGSAQDQAARHSAFNATDLALAKRKDLLVESEETFEGDGFELKLVNQAWGQKDYKFLDSYLDVLARHYGTGMYLTDFMNDREGSRRRINDWIAERTERRITELLPPDAIKPLTRLILTNAIYFKASWLKEFNPDDTAPGTFTAAAGTRDVSMMVRHFEADYAEVDGYRAIVLPYLSPDVRMLLVLPPPGDFAAAAAGFEPRVFDRLRSGFEHHFVMLRLPKWSFASERKLKLPLQALGMNAAFGDRADFSGMDGRPNYLYIDEVYHDAFIAVDEKGTEATAATAVVLPGRGVLDPVMLTFDRPFIFLVYDEPTGQILFLGHLVDPG